MVGLRTRGRSSGSTSLMLSRALSLATALQQASS
jgi:hypothetical protein